MKKYAAILLTLVVISGTPLYAGLCEFWCGTKRVISELDADLRSSLTLCYGEADPAGCERQAEELRRMRYNEAEMREAECRKGCVTDPKPQPSLEIDIWELLLEMQSSPFYDPNRIPWNEANDWSLLP